MGLEDWDITIRLREVKASLGKCKEITCLHRREVGRYIKSLKGEIFLKFVYRYGLKYIFYNPIHFTAFSLRASL